MRTDGTGGKIEGSTRDPRGPKKPVASSKFRRVVLKVSARVVSQTSTASLMAAQLFNATRLDRMKPSKLLELFKEDWISLSLSV